MTNKHRGHEILSSEEAANKSVSQFANVVDSLVHPTSKLVTDELVDLKQVEVLLET